MSQVINTNIMSLTTQNNLNKSQSALATAMQRLSSGLRINSSADDAAGFAISTRMTTQINGLDTATRNANDAVSLAQTASAALQQITDNLQAIRQLAVQSANATNSDSDRAALDQEVQQRLDEITRVAQQTTFNGRHILDGSFGTAAFQVGANVGDTISIDLSAGTGASQIGAVATVSSNLSSTFNTASGLTLAASGLTIKLGSGSAIAVASGHYTSASGLAAAINSAVSGTLGASFATASGNEIVFDNSKTSAVTFSGTSASILGVSGVAAQSTTDGAATSSGVGAAVSGTGLAVAAGDLTIKVGSGTAINVAAATYTSVSGLAAAINTAVSGTTLGSGFATVSGSEIVFDDSTANAVTFGGTDATTLGLSTVAAQTTTDGKTTSSGVSTAVAAASQPQSITLKSGDFSINGTDITGTFSSAQSLADGINAAGIQGVSAYLADSGNLVIQSNGTASDGTTADGDSVKITGSAVPTGITAGTTKASQSLANTDGSGDAMTVKTVAGANDAINRIDAALAAVSSIDSKLGAMQNRFNSAITSAQAVSQNLSASRSRIQDADFAAETAAMSQAQILQQAGVSMLAQANAQPQLVLKLLQ
jgi:flagellin